MSKHTDMYYISGVPGLGKTSWAISNIVTKIQEKSGPVIYVAPTRKLIKQVSNDIIKLLVKKGYTPKDAKNKIIYVHSSPGIKKGANVAEMLKAAVSGREISGLAKMPKFDTDTVVFMTHAGFYSLRPDTIPKEVKSSITVYFDEAKKSVFNRTSIKMNEEAAAAFNSMFTKTKYENSTYFLITPSANYNTATLQTVVKGLSSIREAQYVHSIIQDVKNPSLEVYVSTPEIKAGTRFYGVTLPSKVFKGYKQVTFMAAYFENSQMYHLLKADRTNRLVDITSTLPNYKQRLSYIRQRYSHAVIVPLTVQDTVLTITSLQGILIPRLRLLSLQKKLDKLGLTAADIRKCVDYIHTGYDTERDEVKIQKAVQLIKKAKIQKDPMDWYLRRSEQVVTSWNKSYKETKIPLMFVNNAYQDNIDSDKFRIVSTASHGINAYRDHSIAAFLAAINPDRQMINFMRARVGDEYNYQKDFVVDTCLQSISRSSVRDTESKSKILIILPDLKLAEYVRDSMMELPRIDTRFAIHFGDYVNFSVRSVQKEKQRDKEHISISTERRRANVRKAVAKFNSCPINRQISNTRAYISKAKKTHQGEALEARLAVLQERLDALLAQRDLSNT